VYKHGPLWLGSWEGVSNADICSGLTKVHASHWSTAQEPCEDLIYRKVHATMIGAIAVSAVWLTCTCAYSCMQVSTLFALMRLTQAKHVVLEAQHDK